jgi:hypothetical protein
MQLAPSWLSRLPLLGRGVVLGAMIGLALGGAVGLIVGLVAYPATAWFAVLELGVPASIAGAVVGLLAGAVLSGGGGRRRRADVAEPVS